MTETERPSEKTLDRLGKLLAKAKSAKEIGSEHEAETFMSAVQRELAKYKMELTDLEYRDMQQKDPIKMHQMDPERLGRSRKRKQIAWERRLAEVVATAHFCHIIGSGSGTNVLWLVGRKQDRIICEFMIAYMWNVAESLADKAYVTHFYHCRDTIGDVTLARGFRADFLLGFVGRIAQRYEKEKRAQQAEWEKRPGMLARLSQETAMVKVFMDDLKKTGDLYTAKTPGVKLKGDGDGLLAGAKAADGVKLRHTGLGEAAKTAGIGAGQKLLGGGS